MLYIVDLDFDISGSYACYKKKFNFSPKFSFS